MIGIWANLGLDLAILFNNLLHFEPFYEYLLTWYSSGERQFLSWQSAISSIHFRSKSATRGGRDTLCQP